MSSELFINTANKQKDDAPIVEVIIEVPRGSFMKRGSSGKLDFISPFPCPFNYGSIPAFIGLDGDLLDAVVLGHRLPVGTKVTSLAIEGIGMIDHGLHDDKLICSDSPISPLKKQLILLFFMIYAMAKNLINLLKGLKGLNRCEGWIGANACLARATPSVKNDAEKINR